MSDDGAGYRHKPETEKILRQFLNIDGPKGTTDAYRDNYDRIFGKRAAPEHEALVKPAPCSHCDFVATTIAEINWHESQNAQHHCCPDNAAIGTPKAEH